MPDVAVRTRFAPSPTGYPHVGSIWQALFSWLYARHAGGKFVVRIEDTDRGRLVADAEARILEALRWYGLDYDEGPDVGGPFGPYRQSDRLPLYRAAAEILLASGAAYRCFCSPERLAELRRQREERREPPGYDGRCRTLAPTEAAARHGGGEPCVVRLKFPQRGETVFEDLIRGPVSFQNRLIDDQVLVKSDGWPTYHLAVVVDDYHMRIHPVIRAEEWLPSTPKQIVLYRALGWPAPMFAHLPLILGPDRSKLSKRHGSTDALAFREAGYLPEAVVNFLALLGWNPKTDEEFFSRAELIERFTLRQVNKAGAVFDRQKLDWFNAHYLKTLSPDRLTTLALPYLLKSGLLSAAGESYVCRDGRRVTPSYLAAALAVARERVKRLSDIPSAVPYFFEPASYGTALLNWRTTAAAETLPRLRSLRAFLEGLGEADYDGAALERSVKAFIVREALGAGETLWPWRVSLTGQAESPSPFVVAAVLGKYVTLQRLDEAVGKLSRVV